MANNQKFAQSEFIHAVTKADIKACFEVMKQLRPELLSVEMYLEKVIRMQKSGYQLLAAVENGVPTALAGYRESETLIYGKFIYVDDLISSGSKRGQGLGEQLLKIIFNKAKESQFSRVILDTGIGNSLAQRFYFRVGMLATALHFCYQIEI